MNLHNVRGAVSVLDADMSDSTFVNTRLETSLFTDVNLRNATFTNVSLAGATLEDVNLTGVSVSNVNLAGMRINGILVDDMLRAYRTHAGDGAGSATGASARIAGAVLYAKDVERLRRFYRDVLELAEQSAGDDHVVFGSPGMRLVIVRIPAHLASSITIDVPPRLRADSPAKLVYTTASLAASRDAARRNGGNVLPPEREWDFDGCRVCDGNDSEGNVFQLLERRR